MLLREFSVATSVVLKRIVTIENIADTANSVLLAQCACTVWRWKIRSFASDVTMNVGKDDGENIGQNEAGCSIV